MLSWAEVNTILAHVTYKPGWFVKLVEGTQCHDLAAPLNLSDWWLQVGALVPNSRQQVQAGGHADVTEIGWRVPIHDMDRIDKDTFINFVYHTVFSLEVHEVGEWFAFDGVLLKDPHTNKKIPAPPAKYPAHVNTMVDL